MKGLYHRKIAGFFPARLYPDFKRYFIVRNISRSYSNGRFRKFSDIFSLTKQSFCCSDLTWQRYAGEILQNIFLTYFTIWKGHFVLGRVTQRRRFVFAFISSNSKIRGVSRTHELSKMENFEVIIKEATKSYRNIIFLSATKTGGNTTNILICYFLAKFTSWPIKLNTYTCRK